MQHAVPKLAPTRINDARKDFKLILKLAQLDFANSTQKLLSASAKAAVLSEARNGSEHSMLTELGVAISKPLAKYDREMIAG